jgi:hypothetical protein
MNLQKYKWKNRIILIETPNYNNKEYKKTKDLYQEYIKEFHKRFVKIVTHRKKDIDFKIKLIGFDGKIKKEYSNLIPSKIFKLIDSMLMGNLVNPTNLSLYSDYNPKTTIHGLGFKNKEKAIYTLEKIKNQALKYQVNVVSTMIGRAKNHPHKNEHMEEAIKIFQNWMIDYKKNKK